MKIEIVNIESSNCSGCNIFLGQKRLQNSNKPFNGLKSSDFSNDEIYFILEDKQFKNFENGKYIFDVPKWKIDIITGGGLKNASPYQNKWSYQYNQLK